MKYCVIEIGSNGIKLEKFNIQDGTVNNRRKETFQVDAFSMLENYNNASQSELIRFAENLLKLHISVKAQGYKVFLFGTEFCRSLEKYVPDFWKKYNLRVQVLSGEAEAKYIFLANKSRGYINKEECSLLIDIGNGSTEICNQIDIGKSSFMSIPIGAKILCQKLLENEEEFLNTIQDIFSNKNIPSELEYSNLVLTGGLFSKVSWIINRESDYHRYDSRTINGKYLNQDDVSIFNDRASELISGNKIKDLQLYVDKTELNDWKHWHAVIAGRILDYLHNNKKIKLVRYSEETVRSGVIQYIARNIKK